MQNKTQIKKTQADYVLRESDLAENAKNQLTDLSFEPEKISSTNIKKRKSVCMNGWYESDIQTTKNNNQKQYNKKQLIKSIKQNRTCKTQNDYMSFRCCQKMASSNLKTKQLKKQKLQIKIKLKTQLNCKNISPIFNQSLQRGSVLTKIKNRNNIIHKSFMKNISRYTSQKQQRYLSQNKISQKNDCKESCNFREYRFETQNVSNNKEQSEYQKKKYKKCLKANFPSYFDYKDSANVQYDAFFDRMSPKYCSINNYIEENIKPVSLNGDFITAIKKHIKKRATTQNSSRDFKQTEKIAEHRKKYKNRNYFCYNKLQHCPFRNMNIKQKTINQNFRITQK